MAVSKDDLLIKIQADTANATVNIEKLTTSVSDLGVQILKANAAIELALHVFDGLKVVVGKLSEPFKEAIHASIEYNDKLLKLTNALKITGSYSAASLESFQEFAREMEINTGLSEELTFGMLSLAKSIGLGDGASVKLIKTAKNLSAVTGNDVNDSMNKLLASLKGNIREISTLDPTLKNLSTSALMSGAAVEQLGKKFDGFSEAATKSYKGIIAQSENFKEEIYRNIGDVLATAFDIKGMAEFKRDMYANILETIERIKPSLMAFAEGLADIKSRFMGGVIEKAKEFGGAIVGVYRAIAVLDFQTLAISVTALSVAFGVLFVTIKAEAITTLLMSLQSLIPIIRAMAAAAWAAVVPVALLAAKFIAISAVIIGVAAAVDFFVKNGLNILVGSLNWVISRVELAIGKFMQFIGLVKEGGKMIGLAWKTDDKAAESFSKISMGDTTKAALDKIQEMREAYQGAQEAGGPGQGTTAPDGGFKQVIDPVAKEAYLKALNEIKQRTDQINFDAEKAGMTQLEQLQRIYEMNEKILDQKAEEISLSKDFNDEQKKQLIAALNSEKDANTRKLTSDSKQAPGQEYEAALIAGKSMTSDITKAFQSGTMGMVTGMLGAVNAFVGVAQAAVDFIPGLLNNIANLFNSLTDLPNKIVNGIEGVLKGILNLISNFIPNIFKAIPKIAKMLVEFLKNGLPSAIKALVDAVPEMVMSFIDAIPDIVEAFVIGFVYSLIDMVPLVVIALINQLVPQLPRIAIALVKALTVGLVQAIANGVKSAFGGITKLFTGGKGPKIFDAKDISKELDKIKKLTGSSSDMFGVKDMANGVAEQAQTQAQQLGDAVKNGMDESIRKLIQAWRWVYDNIIAPIGGMLSNAWKGLTQAFDDIFAFFGDIGTMIVDGIKHGIPAIGQMFQDLFNALDPSNIFKKMFNAEGAKGQGAVETALGIDVPFLRFAKGGHVPGQALVSGDNMLNDRILALLSPGEAVIPRSAMQDKRVREIVDSILNGNLKVPAFKLGGVIGKISDAASSATSGGTLGKVFSGDFSGAASDIANMNPKQAAEELAKARDKAIEIVEAMIPGSPWRIVWEKVQEMIMTMFEQNRFAMGGLVTGPSGVDTIPASLSAGEFVLNRGAVSSIGLGNLNRMNAGGQMSGNTVTQNIEITIDARGERIDESFVRQRLMPAIKAELKRSSLDGERTISSRGVR